MEELGSEFDVIVLGTGLPESILAAAATRADFKVLHLDRNNFYGGLWSSFNLKGFSDWATKTPDATGEVLPDVALEGETVHRIQCQPSADVQPPTWHIERCETAEEPAAEGDEKAKEERLGRLRVKAEEDYRRFSLDLAPKAVLSRGSMVELLIRSGVHRYAEFVIADRILTHFDDSFRSVPISRSDVFQSSEVSMMEKRKLMKFLTSVINTDPGEAEEGLFWAFLEKSDLTALLRHYIFSAITMSHQDTTNVEGHSRLRLFLGSVGRFGNSPYLFTLYGSGEMPQFFCRLCAVFGGTYCLDRSVDAILTTDSPEGPRVSGVISGGQRISCRWLVADTSYLPDSFRLPLEKRLHRAVLLTDSPLLPNAPEDKKAHISLFHWGEGGTNVRCLELHPHSMCTPKGIYACQLTVESATDEGTSEDILKPFINKFFSSGPEVLWSLYYSHDTASSALKEAPTNLVVTSPPSSRFTYDDVVTEVEEEERMFEVTNGFKKEEEVKEGESEEADSQPQNEEIPPESPEKESKNPSEATANM